MARGGELDLLYSCSERGISWHDLSVLFCSVLFLLLGHDLLLIFGFRGWRAMHGGIGLGCTIGAGRLELYYDTLLNLFLVAILLPWNFGIS